ncbi:helix-turn-helix domain-containing protein [Kitasatospora sp. NPDC101157]|uniref:helix-turn-helix domain-containing protein n=1 Tax=Kitasatospora sp. NPDC101157 TaxID=3364098 RepID=UPI0038088733
MRPVGAIGRRWGFADSAVFSRVFKAAYGMPPGEYRTLAGRTSDVPSPPGR